MKRSLRIAAIGILAALAFMPAAAMAQSVVLDQVPAPVPSASNTNQNSELYLQSSAVTGGTLYSHILKAPGANGGVVGVSDVFVPTGTGGGLLRYLNLTDAKSDLGVPMTAAAGTPAGTVGISRTNGTSMVLAGEATSASAKTDKALWETNVATTYAAGANIPIVINANYTGGGTVTAASTTITMQAFTEVNGVETALSVTAAQQFTGTAANYTFTITGTGLVPGAHITVEAVMLVTTSAGAATGQINSVALTM